MKVAVTLLDIVLCRLGTAWGRWGNCTTESSPECATNLGGAM